MPRARTGTLVAPGADGFWRCRVTKDKPDGTTWRPLYSLGTADKTLAKRKLARINELLAQGVDPFDAAEIVGGPEHVREYAEAWLTAREGRGVAKARWERSYFRNHVADAIGHMPLGDVRPAQVRTILEDAAGKGLKRATVAEVRGLLFRVFDHAWRAEIIETNPVARVKLLEMRETRKERCILTNDEFSHFIACPDDDLELRMMALVARCEGGMRTGDLHKWDWSMIDRVRFHGDLHPEGEDADSAAARDPRGARTVPPRLAPSAPASRRAVPFSSVRLGKRARGKRSARTGHAKRLRLALQRAGVFRLPPVEVLDIGKGRRTDPRPLPALRAA